MISFFVPILETFAIYTGYLQGLKNFKLQAFLYSLQRIIVVLITIIAILFSGNLFIVMLTYLITTSLMQWLGYFITLTKYPPNLNIDSEAISFGKYLSLIGLARIGAQGLDKIALWYFAGSVQVAMYVISIALPGEIVSAFGQINNVAFTKMAEKEHFNLRLSLLKKYFTFFLLLIPIVIIYILAVPLVFKLMFPQYLDSVFFTQIASLLILFVPNGLLNHYLIITNHKRGLYTINFSEPLITLLLYALLIPFLGVIGAIFTLILKNVINTIILLYFFITHKIENF